MVGPVSVSISGPVFSFIFYELSKAVPKQYGFFIGDIIQKEDVVITDHDQRQVNVSTTIKITSTVSCPNSYISKGRVNEEQMRKLLGPNFSKVVGWYKSEPNPIISCHLKDALILKQLEKLFAIPDNMFFICTLGMNFKPDLSSFSFHQTFIRNVGENTREMLNVRIPNLGELDNAYKSSEPVSRVFSEILSSIDIANAKGVAAVMEIGNALQSHMEKMCKELIESEEELRKLEQEVDLSKLLNNKVKPELDSESSIEESSNVASDDQRNELEKVIEDHLESNKMTLRTRAKAHTPPDSNRKVSLSDIDKSPRKTNVKINM